MPAPLFSPESSGTLAVMLMILSGVGYLLSIRGKSPATRYLVLTTGALFVSNAYLLASDAWPFLWWTPEYKILYLMLNVVPFNVVFWALVQFVYRFVEAPYPRESRVVAWVTAVLLVAITVAERLAAQAGRFDLSRLLGSVGLVLVLLFMVWTVGVLGRKWRRARRGETPLDRPERAARAYLSFALLVGLLVAHYLMRSLVRFTPLDWTGWVIALDQITLLAFIFGLVLVYLTHAPEPTTVQARLIGLALVTPLALVVAVSTLVDTETRSAFESGDGVPSRQTLRYTPSADGGYTLDRVPYVPSVLRGDTLRVVGDGRSQYVALGLDFPFGEGRWDLANVTPFGTIAFGAAAGGLSTLWEGVPHVLPLRMTLTPADGGAVRIDRAPGRATILWDAVPEAITGRLFTFGVTFFADGTIEMTYDRVAPPLIGAGVTAGRGIFPGPAPVTADTHVPLAETYPVRIAPGAAYIEDPILTYRLGVRRISNGLLVLTLMATGLVLVVFLVVFRGSLIRPLRRLLDGVRRVDAGDLDTAVPVGTQDEFGRLAGGFNDMTASLRRYSGEMEDLVAERTAELEEAQGRLIHQEKMASLGQLTAGIAHEIKNPLNFVTNFAGLSRELVDELGEVASDEERAEILSDLRDNAEKIEAHGRRADAIVSAMMEHARSGTGARRDVSLDRLVEEYAGLALHALQARRPDAEVTLNFDLGDAGSAEVVPEEVGRVVVNLVDNALDATRQRAEAEGVGYEPRVTVSTGRSDGQVEIRVADNGSGMAPEVAAKVFEPFFTTKPAGEGTGLGLSLAHDIVTQGHRGTLAVESEEGRGSTFTLRLPRGDTP